MRPFLIAGIVVVIDQIAKAIATAHLRCETSYTLINKICSLTLVNNTGAAFGLFRNQALIFTFISAAAIISIGFYLIKKKAAYYLPMALILGGAVGNLIDRLRFGHVIDFIDFHIWPVFNVADSCITIGTIILFFFIIKGENVSHSL